MKRPSMQFYPGDWQSNPKLRRCSHGEKGIWLDVLCILHDQDEYGIVRWPLKELARAVNATHRALQRLVDKGVLKGTDSGDCVPYIYVPRHARKDGDPVTLVAAQPGPIWFSSRMVRDEHIRNTAGATTRFSSKEQSGNARPRRTQAGTERERLRQAVFDKTGGRCFHCKEPLADDWEIDHFIPRSKGGTGSFTNLVPSCKQCNQDKCDTMPCDWSAPARAQGERQGVHPSRAGASSSSSTSASTEKKERRADKPRDPRQDHPAIQAVREAKGSFPVKDTWDLVIKAVGDKPDLERMKECWLAWRGKGHSPMNLDWLIDWYINGIPGARNGTNKNRPESGSERSSRNLRENAQYIRSLSSGDSESDSQDPVGLLTSGIRNTRAGSRG